MLPNFSTLFYEPWFDLCHVNSLPSEQLIIYQVGVLPSRFYNVLADQDYSGFRSLVAKAMVLIIINSTVSCGAFVCGWTLFDLIVYVIALKEAPAVSLRPLCQSVMSR